MNCPKCGSPIEAGWVCCPVCGRRLVALTKTSGSSRRRANGMGSVRKRGKTWTAISPPRPCVVNGKVIRRPITKGGFRTKTEALLAAPTLGERRKLEASRLTFAEIYEKWLTRHANRVVAGTLGCYKAAYNQHFKDLHAAIFVDLVTEDWQGCVDDCVAGKRTKQNMKALGTLLYQYAMEQNITDKDYARFIYIENTQQVSRNAFTREEVKRIIACAHAGVRYADYIACGCYLGFRPTALFLLTKDDYDQEEHTITGGIKTAAGRNRTIPVSPVIQPFIDRLLSTDSDFLFPNPAGGQFTNDNFRKAFFYEALATMGIQPIPQPGEAPKYTPYSWRHTFFTMMGRVPGEDKLKAELGGHTSYEMSKHYEHPDLEDKRAIIAHLGE